MPTRATAATITGPRVYLRPPRVDDAAAFLAAVRASRSLHGPWTRLPTPGALRGLRRPLRADAAGDDARGLPRLSAGRRRPPRRLQLLRDRARRVLQRVPRLLRLRAALRTRVHDRGHGARARRRVPQAQAAPGRSQHPADQRALARACEAHRLHARGLLAPLREDRRPLARPRALRDAGRGLGEAPAQASGRSGSARRAPSG